MRRQQNQCIPEPFKIKYNMLKMQVIGHLGKDAEIRNVNGKNVINFSVAHSEKFKDQQGNQQEKTTWVECAYWSDSQVGQYLKKGTQVYAEGVPDVRTWEGKDGKQGVTLSLRVFSVQLLGSPQQQPQQPQQAQWGAPPPQQPQGQWGAPPPPQPQQPWPAPQPQQPWPAQPAQEAQQGAPW